MTGTIAHKIRESGTAGPAGLTGAMSSVRVLGEPDTYCRGDIALGIFRRVGIFKRLREVLSIGVRERSPIQRSVWRFY